MPTAKKKYLEGNFGYGHAKQALFELILERFSKERSKYDYYMNHLDELEDELQKGAVKASEIANVVLDRVRKKVGY